MNLTPTTIRHDKVLLGKGVSQGKKMGELRNEFLQCLVKRD